MNDNQVKLKLNKALISALILISILFVSNQGNIKNLIDGNHPNEFSTPETPRESYIHYEDTSGMAVDVYVSGDYAYIADYDSGLAIIDISNPKNPGTPVYEDTTGDALSLYISGDYAYIADGYSGLAIIDISDPTNPGAPVYEDTNGYAGNIYVSGDYAYIADGPSGLAIIDISNPTNPGTPVYEDTTSSAYGVCVSGNYAYMADASSGLAVIDISDPTSPGSPFYEDTTGRALGVYVSGDYAYIADFDSGLAIIDISNPTNPGTPVYEDTIGSARNVYVSGDYTYVADYAADQSSGLAIIDISDPTNPGTPIYENTTGSAYGVYVDGNYAYVADALSGLAIIEISEPMEPEFIVLRTTKASASDVYVSGDYAYLAYQEGLAIIDISDPTNPGTPIYKGTTAWARGVYVSGDYAYIADFDSGLAIINISDPSNPGTPVYEDTTGTAFEVYVSGNYAYIADGQSGLAIIDISDPTNPGTPVYEDTTSSAHGVYVSGDYAYVADATSGLAVIDISNPTNPGTPIYEDTTGNPGGVYVSGDYAYVADGLSGLAVIDISDPTNPGPTFHEDTTGSAGDVYVSGDYAYIADGPSGLAIIDISDPTNPLTPIYEFNTANGVYLNGKYAYMAYSSMVNYGLAVLQIRGDYGMLEPTIISSPNDFSVEVGYTDLTISWTATDYNPNNYFIELKGTGIVAGPTPWLDNEPIIYHIPDELDLGDYIYTINITDDYSHFIIDTVVLTVESATNPIVISAPNDIFVEVGYDNTIPIVWIVTDPHPNTYTIILEGLGIVEGPSIWLNGTPITYNVPNGLSLGEYIYTINITDDYSYFTTDTVILTVQDSTAPIIEEAPSDFTVDFGYTGISISWTATDPNPDIYTIELQGTGIIAGPSLWSSGVAIIYNVPNGLSLGEYIYTINITDDYSHFTIDTVVLTVQDSTAPIIEETPSDFTVEFGYMGISISWIATDFHPNIYTIELQGTGIVAGPNAWLNGTAITYNVPEGLAVGEYFYSVNFTDDYGNYATDTIKMIVTDTSVPIIINAPSDFTVDYNYLGINFSWTATDFHPNVYTIELQGIGIVAGPNAWLNGTAITYNVPEGFFLGEYFYTVNFTDDYGNYATDTIKMTITDSSIPIITNAPSNFTVDYGYNGVIISWTATDLHPSTYTIELQGSGIIAGPSTWLNGTVITYNVPNGLSVGDYIFTVNFTDDYDNYGMHTVKMTVREVESLLYVEIIDQSFSIEEFNITFFIHNTTGFGIDFAFFQIWWNGIDVSADIQNLGNGLYSVSLDSITVAPGENPILLNMIISASGYESKFFETYIAVDPASLLKGEGEPTEEFPLTLIIVISALSAGAIIGVISIYWFKKRKS